MTLRLPTGRVYRAFPELDQFSDAECRRLLGRAQRATPWMNRVVALVIAVVFLPGAAMGAILGWSASGAILGAAGGAWSDAGRVVSIAVGTAVPSITALMIGDAWLRRSVRSQLLRCECPVCRYSLLGLHPSLGAVTCPECGTEHALSALGLAPVDILAPLMETGATRRAGAGTSV